MRKGTILTLAGASVAAIAAGEKNFEGNAHASYTPTVPSLTVFA